jgi:bla regulator protein blaR1
MIQSLLADRFQLTFHRDKRELSVYAIRIAKSGSRMARSDSDPHGLPGFTIGRRELRFRNTTMAEFASILQGAGSIVDRPVVDQTGLVSTRYDFDLKWTPDTSQPPPDNADAPPGFFTAFQEQLGLKLEPIKAPVEVLVIDHVERPSEN